jgi:hypothetical protein
MKVAADRRARENLAKRELVSEKVRRRDQGWHDKCGTIRQAYRQVVRRCQVLTFPSPSCTSSTPVQVASKKETMNLRIRGAKSAKLKEMR